MADPVLVGAANFRAVSDTTTRTISTAAIVNAAGTTVALQDGDLLFLLVFYSGATTTNSVSGLTGLTKLDDNVGGGTTSTLYYKVNCVASTDAAATITVTTSTTNRTNGILLVFRNVPATAAAAFSTQWAKNFQGSANSSNGPTVTPTILGSIRLELAVWSSNVTPSVVPTPDVGAGLTQIRTEANSPGTMPGHVGAMTGSTLGTGTSTGNAAVQMTPITTLTSVGGTTWSSDPAITPAAGSSKWIIMIAGVSDITSVFPASTISSTGMSLVGTAGSFVLALGDNDDTTLAETSDDPVSIVIEEKFASNLTPKARVGLKSRLKVTSTTGTGSVSILIQIRQGASTVICSHTVVVSVTDGIVPDDLLSLTSEASAITDWTDLRGRWTFTKV